MSISVARMLIARTSPSRSPMATQSPTFTGRSTRRIRPETKLPMMDCRPKPMPTDRALAKRVIWLKLNPRYAKASSSARAESQVGKQRRQRGPHPDVHAGLGKIAVLQPAANGAGRQQTRQEEADAAEHRARRNRHLAQGEDRLGRGDALENIAGARAKGEQDRRPAEEQQDQPREAGKQHRGMLDGVILDPTGPRRRRPSGERSDSTAGKTSSAKRNRQRQQCKDGADPDGLAHQKAGEGKVAGQQRDHRRGERKPGGQGGQHPDNPRLVPRRGMLRCVIGARAPRPGQGEQQRADSDDFDDHREPLAGDRGGQIRRPAPNPSTRHEKRQSRGDSDNVPDRTPAAPPAHRRAGRQTPRRVTGGEQRAADALQKTGDDQSRE